MEAGVPVYFASAEAATPFLEGVLVEEAADERCLVRPSSGTEPFWLPKSSVFLKSPAAAGAHAAHAAQQPALR